MASDESLDSPSKSNPNLMSYFTSFFNLLNQNRKFKLFFNFLLMFALIHEILICLFSGFNLKSIFIFIIVSTLLPKIKLELDEEIIMIFLGLFLGVRAVRLTLTEGWFNPFSMEPLDPLISNWIMFISAPLLGILLFFIMRFSVEYFNQSPEENMNEE